MSLNWVADNLAADLSSDGNLTYLLIRAYLMLKKYGGDRKKFEKELMQALDIIKSWD